MNSYKNILFSGVTVLFSMMSIPMLAKEKVLSEVEAESELPAVEFNTVGVKIYPQRMSLHGEETLMDILLLYPGMLIGGFDNVLNQFSLNVDNKLILGNIRNMLNKVLAKDVVSIAVVDNPGVSKGVAGMGGSIVVKFLHHEG